MILLMHIHEKLVVCHQCLCLTSALLLINIYFFSFPGGRWHTLFVIFSSYSGGALYMQFSLAHSIPHSIPDSNRYLLWLSLSLSHLLFCPWDNHGWSQWPRVTLGWPWVTPWGLLEGSLRVPRGLLEGSLRAPWGLLEGSLRAPRGLLQDSSRAP